MLYFIKYFIKYVYILEISLTHKCDTNFIDNIYVRCDRYWGWGRTIYSNFHAILPILMFFKSRYFSLWNCRIIISFDVWVEVNWGIFWLIIHLLWCRPSCSEVGLTARVGRLLGEGIEWSGGRYIFWSSLCVIILDIIIIRTRFKYDILTLIGIKKIYFLIVYLLF